MQNLFTNDKVRYAITLVVGAVIGFFGSGFFSQTADVEQVVATESAPANTAEAVVETITEPEATSPEEMVETPATAPIEG
jgi:hypothetical protein